MLTYTRRKIYREGYETLLNTDVKLEQENIANLMHMAVDYGRSIGFKGDFYIEPKPKEPMSHQYDFDAATAAASPPALPRTKTDTNARSRSFVLGSSSDLCEVDFINSILLNKLHFQVAFFQKFINSP